jgi:hypothetical protein
VVAGGDDEDYPFVTMAASLDANDYLQHDFDSIGEATLLLAICSNVRRNPQAEGYDMAIQPAAYWEAERHSTDAGKWRKVTGKELGDLKRMEAYEDVDELPEGKKLIGCRWVYELKIDESGGPSICKTVPFVDYRATFAPFAKSVTVQFGAVYSALQGRDLQCFDITCAFLWDLTIVICIRRPPPLPPGLFRLVMWIHQEIFIDSFLTEHNLVPCSVAKVRKVVARPGGVSGSAGNARGSDLK